MARKSKPRRLKKSIVILVDGESEIAYLNSLKKQSNIKIVPELPKKKSFNDTYNLFKEYLKDDSINELYWIIDLDVVIREDNIDTLKDINNKYSNIIINNPCLEIWFLMHYEAKNFSNSCDRVISYLKRKDEFKNYTKSPKEIPKITEKLLKKGLLKNAITNSKSRECNFETLNSCSTMYILFDNVFKIEE